MNQQFMKRRHALANLIGFGLTGRAATCTEVRNSNPSGVRETNRVSNWLFRMVALIAIVLSGSLFVCKTAQAGISLKSITPAENSEISAFEFVMNFDISEAKTLYPDIADNIGIGCSGTSKKCANLYKGDQESGELIGTALTKAVTGASENFVIGGSFTFSFDDIYPEESTTYTLVIGNTFTVYEKGATKNVDKVFNYTDGFTFSFTGKANSFDFVQVSSSILKDTKQESFNDIVLTFNFPVTISDNPKAFLLQNEEEYATASSFIVDPENENAVIISFPNIPLYKNTSYTFVCESGSIIMRDESSKSNEEFCLSLQGDAVKPFTVKAKTPETSFNGIVTTASIKFELPEKAEILEYNGSLTYSYPAVLYKKENGEKIVISNLSGKPFETGDGVEWKVNGELLPETEYVIIVPKNSIYAYTYSATTGRYTRLSDMSNGEIEFSFTTPSIENKNLDFMVFMNPALDENRRDLLDTSAPIESLDKLFFQLESNFYSYLGENFTLRFLKEHEGASVVYDYGFLYKVTDSGDVKIKDVPLGYGQRITDDGDPYWTILATLNSRFYENIHYKFVIPAGIISVNSQALKNFIFNDEIVVEFEGKADSKLQLTCSSLREGERVSHVSAVAFHSDQELALIDSYAVMLLRDMEGNVLKRAAYSLYHENINSVMGGVPKYITRVMADFSDRNSFTPFYLPKTSEEYQIVISPGTLMLANDPEITNQEIIVNVKRVPETGLTEYVNLTYVVNEHAATVLPIEKGLKAKLQLTPSDDWKIEKVMFNETDVTSDVDENGNYETPAVRIDSRMEVHLGFNGELYFNYETGVVEVPNTDLRVMSEDERIKIEGLSEGDNIKVYTMAGVLLAEDYANEDIAYIKAPKETVYIVVITDTNGRKSAVKIIH